MTLGTNWVNSNTKSTRQDIMGLLFILLGVSLILGENPNLCDREKCPTDFENASLFRINLASYS